MNKTLYYRKMKGFFLNLLNTNHENQTPESWPGALQCDDSIPGRRAGHQEDAGASLEHCLSLGEAS